MKAAPDSPKAGEVVETVTQRRVIQAEPAGKEKTTPDFWFYLEALRPADWDRHLLYIYRRDSDNGPMIPLEKCTGFLTMQDGTQVPLSDREATEFAIAQKYGGRVFRLILKRGSERVTETRVHVDAPPKNTQPAIFSDGGPRVTDMGSDSAAADVAHHAISTLAGQDRVVMDVAVNAVKGAAEIVQRMSQGPQNGNSGSETDQLMKMCMIKMLERAMNPPDPIELLTKLMALQGQMGGSGGTPSPIINRVLDQAVEKLLNPAPSGPISSAGAELVRQLPQVASYVTSAIAEWRAGTEAQRDTAAIMRGVQPPAGRPAQAPSTVLPAPPVNNPAPGGNGVPSLEFIESRIVQIFREPVSAEEAADKTLEFLETIDPQLVTQLTAQGEQGLIGLFHARPILRPAAQNVPRLTEFIRAFLKFASEGDSAAAEAKPN